MIKVSFCDGRLDGFSEKCGISDCGISVKEELLVPPLPDYAVFLAWRQIPHSTIC